MTPGSETPSPVKPNEERVAQARRTLELYDDHEGVLGFLTIGEQLALLDSYARLAEVERDMRRVRAERDSSRKAVGLFEDDRRVAVARLAEVEEALRWYANEKNWLPATPNAPLGSSPVDADAGRRARAALRGSGSPEEPTHGDRT